MIHDFVAISVGLYDTTYRCKNCGMEYIDSVDNQIQIVLPECTVKPLEIVHEFPSSTTDGMMEKFTGDPKYKQRIVDMITENPVIHLSQSELTLRDHFAIKASDDEIKETSHRTLSRVAGEALAGFKYPEKPREGSGREALIKYQLDEFKFRCAVSAALRFIYADAMLAARNKYGETKTDDLIERRAIGTGVIDTEQPLCWVDKNDLEKLKQGKGATVYGHAEHMMFSTHHYLPLYDLSPLTEGKNNETDI